MTASHGRSRCEHCRRWYTPSPVVGARQRFCSSPCKSAWRRNKYRAKPENPLGRTRLPDVWERTPLNELVDALYAACNGTHVPSGKLVYRDLTGEGRWLPVCSMCGVPISGKVGWNRKFIEGEEAA